MSDEIYFIAAGVRRAVAARERGLRVIPAKLIEDGNTIRQWVVSLDQLVSPKDRVSRSDPRYQRVFALLATPAGRMRMPDIEVEHVSTERAALLTKLSDVLLEL